jgi:hypothetical protein
VKKPKFKNGDNVYYVWEKKLRTGEFVEFSGADPEVAFVTGRVPPIAIEYLSKTATGAKRIEAKRLVKDGVEVFESFGRDEFKRAMRIRKHAQKFDPSIPLEPTWLGELREAVRQCPVMPKAFTTMVGHKELAEAVAFIESTLGVKEPRRKPVPEERYS